MVFQKLYPPYIEGKLPAQVGDTLNIPYQLNRAQGINDLTGKKILIRIKTATTNNLVVDGAETTFESNEKNGFFSATFITGEENCTTMINGKNVDWLWINKLQVGQFYKVQLAFEGGYYSTVGVFKYTAIPTIKIVDLDESNINSTYAQFKGEYTIPEKDTNEKVALYCFNVYKNGQLYDTSGELIHNPDDEFDVFQTNKYFEKDEYYYIQYNVTTVNNLYVSSPLYCIRNAEYLIPLNLSASLIAENNYDDGFISIGLKANRNDTLRGTYYLLRKEEDGESWDTISNLTLNYIIKENESLELFKDFTVKQGIKYLYALQQYSDYVITDKKLAESWVCADFEDAFLYDGERQLKIRFNPKISSFKTTTLETKLDTIGGQYPFFFKNGRTAYKDFPISGLISLQMDENGYFIQKENKEEQRSETNSKNIMDSFKRTDLISQNITDEREFKLQVLNWLNNGKPKLFRAPQEGNYLVRLMNVSLSPNDTLGRMIHTFNSNAYEIAEITNKKMLELNILSKENKDCLNYINFNSSFLKKEINIPKATYARIIDANPGTRLKLTFADDSFNEIIIGNTGYYEVFINKQNPLVKVENLSIIEMEESNGTTPGGSISYIYTGYTGIHYVFAYPIKQYGQNSSIYLYAQWWENENQLSFTNGTPPVSGDTTRAVVIKQSYNNKSNFYSLYVDLKPQQQLYLYDAGGAFTYYKPYLVPGKGKIEYGYSKELDYPIVNDKGKQIIRVDSKDVVDQISTADIYNKFNLFSFNSEMYEKGNSSILSIESGIFKRTIGNNAVGLQNLLIVKDEKTLTLQKGEYNFDMAFISNPGNIPRNNVRLLIENDEKKKLDDGNFTLEKDSKIMRVSLIQSITHQPNAEIKFLPIVYKNITEKEKTFFFASNQKKLKFIRICKKDIFNYNPAIGLDLVLKTSLYRNENDGYFYDLKSGRKISDTAKMYIAKIKNASGVETELDLSHGRIEYSGEEASQITELILGDGLYADVLYQQIELEVE